MLVASQLNSSRDVTHSYYYIYYYLTIIRCTLTTSNRNSVILRRTFAFRKYCLLLRLFVLSSSKYFYYIWDGKTFKDENLQSSPRWIEGTSEWLAAPTKLLLDEGSLSSCKEHLFVFFKFLCINWVRVWKLFLKTFAFNLIKTIFLLLTNNISF